MSNTRRSFEAVRASDCFRVFPKPTVFCLIFETQPLRVTQFGKQETVFWQLSLVTRKTSDSRSIHLMSLSFSTAVFCFSSKHTTSGGKTVRNSSETKDYLLTVVTDRAETRDSYPTGDCFVFLDNTTASRGRTTAETKDGLLTVAKTRVFRDWSCFVLRKLSLFGWFATRRCSCFLQHY